MTHIPKKVAFHLLRLISLAPSFVSLLGSLSLYKFSNIRASFFSSPVFILSISKGHFGPEGKVNAQTTSTDLYNLSMDRNIDFSTQWHWEDCDLLKNNNQFITVPYVHLTTVSNSDVDGKAQKRRLAANNCYLIFFSVSVNIRRLSYVWYILIFISNIAACVTCADLFIRVFFSLSLFYAILLKIWILQSHTHTQIKFNETHIEMQY